MKALGEQLKNMKSDSDDSSDSDVEKMELNTKMLANLEYDSDTSDDSDSS